MKNKMRVVLSFFVLFIVFFIIGVYVVTRSDFKKSFEESYQKSFKSSFKMTFMLTCRGLDKSQQRMTLCDCIGNELLNQLSVEELKNQNSSKKYIEVYILPGCIEKSKSDSGV